VTTYRERCAALAETLREVGPGHDDESAILIGFICAAEFTTPSGTRWLARYIGDGDGDPDGITIWQGDGYLHHSMSATWPTEEDE
jgi:hypothetical protein